MWSKIYKKDLVYLQYIYASLQLIKRNDRLINTSVFENNNAMFTDYEGIQLAKIYADNPVHDHETPMQNKLGFLLAFCFCESITI